MIAFIRFWKEGAIGVLLAALALAWIGKTAAEHEADRLQAALRAARQTIGREREAARAAAALAHAQDAANAARAERDQIRLSQEVQNDYQKQLGDLRRRHDALRLRSDGSRADSGARAGAPVPGLSRAAQGADDSTRKDGLPLADALIASEQALRLKALQEWVRAQADLAESAPAGPEGQ